MFLSPHANGCMLGVCMGTCVCAKVVSWQGRGGQELLGRSPWVGGGRRAGPWARSGMGMGAQMCVRIYGGRG